MAITIRVAVGACVATAGLPAQAQPNPQRAVVATPDYDSGAAAGPLSDANFNTPESDGRPGVKFFAYGTQALEKRDYKHAIDMFKVSASWAYKPAQYLLGLMYFSGEGVPADRPLGTAWMILAAERQDPAYVKMRNQMVTVLTDMQFNRADALWGQLRVTYGDKVALRRAKVQWVWVKNHQTGSRVGGNPGELHVGIFTMRPIGHPSRGGPAVMSSALGLLQSGSVDGSLAYRQFQQSDDPYSPMFLKNHTGTVTVSPLQELKEGEETSGKAANKPAPSSSGQDQQKPND